MSATPFWVNPSTSTAMPFKPVKVQKGRKYRGTGFLVKVTNDSGACGWRHGAYGWEANTYDVDTAKIWVPSLGKFQYANAKYVEDDLSVTDEECKRAYQEFADKTIEDTIEWCKSKRPGASLAEVHLFARRVLLKNYPFMEAEINIRLPFMEDSLRIEVESTVKWAKSLNNLSTKDAWIKIAKRALEKRGVASNEGFEDVFQSVCYAYATA